MLNVDDFHRLNIHHMEQSCFKIVDGYLAHLDRRVRVRYSMLIALERPNPNRLTPNHQIRHLKISALNN